MSDLQKVLVRKQNEDFKVVKTDTLELEYLQSQVGGLIELISWSDNLDSLGVDMWINEEGKLIKLIKKCNARGGTDNITVAYLVKEGGIE